MTTTRPQVEMDGLYNQRQAAEALKVERHTLRRYELAGAIKFRMRRAGRSKVVSGAQIIKCWESMYL